MSILILFLHFNLLNAQDPLTDAFGSVRVGQSQDSSPPPGTIRFEGEDLKGWNGFFWISFTDHAIVGFVNDIDGNTYKTIRIGNQEWMSENLRTTKYNDNTFIPNLELNSDWTTATQGAWCWYGNQSIFDIPYGKLYNWIAVNTGKLCPLEWHVSTLEDWTTLRLLVTNADLRDIGTSHWIPPNADATNETGFTAVGNGKRAGFSGYFENLQEYSSIWVAEEYNTNNGQDVGVGPTNKTGFSTPDKRSGLAVRCVKN